jgi:two-component system response regulator AlgR
VKFLIVDDELLARSRLRRLLRDVPGCEVLGEAASGDEALRHLERLEPDVLLLDISMPGLDGMRLAQVLRRRRRAPAVIFCTALPDQALEAFETGAVDYLLKPVRLERLREAVDRAARFLGDAGPREFVSSHVGGREVLIELGDVACLLAEDKYTTVLHDGRRTVIDDSLLDLERLHGDRLLRVHRNALVARNRIRGLERVAGGAYRVLLEDCDFSPQVSRRRLPAVRKIIKEMQ